MREVLDSDARQRSGKSILRLRQCRHHHLVEQRRIGHRNAVEILLDGGAQDVAGSNAVLLSRQFITTMRPANTFEDAVASQGLQYRLEMPRRPPKSPRQRLSRYRLVTRIERDIDDRGDRQNAFGRQKLHGQSRSWRTQREGALLLF